MYEVPIPGKDDELGKLVMGQYGPPAFLRRAQRVQAAFDHVIAQCRSKRDEWLVMVRINLGQLHGLAGAWAALAPLVADDSQVDMLRQLHTLLEPKLRGSVEATSSPRVLRRTLAELIADLENFNRQWQAFLPTVDLGEINKQREDYNRYYLLEKECAVRSPRVARLGYRPLAPATVEEIAQALPLLPVPLMK